MDAREKLRHIIANAKSDDLERAERSFAAMTPWQMASGGGSGKTRQELLDAYRQERADWQAASDLLDSLLHHATQRR